MVGVWIEPVIAQLIMILLAMVFLSPSEQCATGGYGENVRCQRGVISRRRCGGHPFCTAQGRRHRTAVAALPAPPRRAVASLSGRHNCTLKPNFRRLKRLACRPLWTGSHG